MTTHVVEAVGLSKSYSIASSNVGKYRTLRDDIANRMRRTEHHRPATVIRAVDDLNLVIDPGESIGVLGRNGAGKSTLMKLLSRVTTPTAGYADVATRVGALLEVGTGFHPELTGRENVYLSGAILGMSKREVRDRFDDIVAFAELPEFIDAPVKHYSSGMYARLGFAVAAHLRPALLIVDEVLSVGDLSFQAKCLAHMKRLTVDGVAILFVSHNLRAVADFCGRVLVMENGRLRFDGQVTPAIEDYRASLKARDDESSAGSNGNGRAVFINGAPADSPILIDSGADLRVDVAVPGAAKTGRSTVIVNLVIETEDGRVAVHLRNDLVGSELHLDHDSSLLGVTIDSLPLTPGEYWLWLRIVAGDPTSPSMWDTDRMMLTVNGARTVEAVMQPRHRFHSDHGSSPIRSDIPISGVAE
jgi:lipopolysaccharide transport system ATP-binding protein